MKLLWTVLEAPRIRSDRRRWQSRSRRAARGVVGFDGWQISESEDAGRAYYLRCKHILEEFDDANREASGKLRVAAPVSFGAMHVQDVVKRYLGERLQVDRDIPLDERSVDLRSEWTDVAIRLDRAPDSQLIARQLASGKGFKRSSNFS